MCTTCGCNKPKDKHGMRTLAAANKKFDKTKKKPTKSLSPKQKKIAGAAAPANKITGADFKALKKGKK